jgi:hypothetical protein
MPCTLDMDTQNTTHKQVLLRHMCWMEDVLQSAKNRTGRDSARPRNAGRVVVCDGVMVCLGSRHAYLSGNTRAQGLVDDNGYP